MTGASEAMTDYRLAPGAVVYDQPHLSGQLIIDGGGGILLPLVEAVSLKGLTLAAAQHQQRFADGVLVEPAVSLGITEHRPVFVTGSVLADFAGCSLRCCNNFNACLHIRGCTATFDWLLSKIN